MDTNLVFTQNPLVNYNSYKDFHILLTVGRRWKQSMKSAEAETQISQLILNMWWFCDFPSDDQVVFK